jgi:hypothetical protein
MSLFLNSPNCLVKHPQKKKWTKMGEKVHCAIAQCCYAAPAGICHDSKKDVIGGHFI